MAQSPIWTQFYEPGLDAGMPPLPYQGLAAFVRGWAKAYGDKKAYSICLPTGSGASLSYAQVDQASDAFAAFLRFELGLRPGARVALQMPNCLAFPVAAFGVFKAGCVLVNTNPLYTPPEMEHQFKDSGAEALVIIDLFADKLKDILPRTAIKHVITVSLTEFFPAFSGALVRFVLKYVKKQVPACPAPAIAFGQALQAGEAHLKGGLAELQGGSGDEVAVLQYTGGTTGVSKGAMLSHKNLLSNVEQAYAFCAHRITLGQEVVLAPLPLYHVFAFTVNLLTFYRTGAEGVLVPSPRPISNLKAVFKKHPITWMVGVNTLYAALLNEKWVDLTALRELKVAIAGGAALHQAIAERWKLLTGDPVTEGYGLTEASPVVCFNPLGKGRLGCIGVPLPGTKVRMLKEDGSEAAVGEPGELCVQGDQVMLGYWAKRDESAKVLKDGWLHTGDVALFEPDGFVRIVDRLKDVVMVSGFKVFPNEVEDCLARLEGVAECAVIGVPAGEAGEAVKAFIVLKPGAALTIEQVREHCKQSLTAYKVPKFVDFRKDLPKTNIGKILRKELKAEEAAKAKAS